MSFSKSTMKKILEKGKERLNELERNINFEDQVKIAPWVPRSIFNWHCGQPMVRVKIWAVWRMSISNYYETVKICPVCFHRKKS